MKFPYRVIILSFPTSTNVVNLGSGGRTKERQLPKIQ